MKNNRLILLLFAPACLALMSFVIRKEGGFSTNEWLAMAAGAGLTGWAARHFWRKKLGPAIAEKYPDKKRMGCCGVIAVILVATGCVLLIRACS